MIAAIPLSLLLAGTATSQSTVSNTQVQAGDVFSSQTLDVVTASSDTTATTTATGNSFVGSVVSGGVTVTSSQTVSGALQAQTVLNVASDAGPSTTLTTAATGNSGDSVISGGGTLAGNYTQTSTSATIDAESSIAGPNAQTADAAVAVQAIGNSQGFGSTDSTIATTTTQSNSATVTANGGAILGDIPDQASFSAVGNGNNVTSVGAGASTQTLAVNQTNTGAVTQGTMFVNLGNSEVTSTNATATGNNLNATNTEGALSVGVGQDNQSYVRAQAVETSFAFGGANVSAYGVGNSVMAGNIGPSTALNNVQTNGPAGVQSIASFSGDNGFDAFVSSTATGNAATGFACSACGGVINVGNTQTNLGDIGATGSVTLTNGARSVRSTVTAVGNTGSFYVSSPGQ
ncbi:MAG: holdfast anchor protein HfaD [Caulobacterales bacterium]